MRCLNSASGGGNVANSQHDDTKCIVVPYVPLINNKLQKELRQRCNIRIFNFIPNKSSFIKHKKDKIPKMSKSKVVYEQKCNNCDKVYVGQSSRKMKERVGEHKNNINQSCYRQNSLTKHRIDTSHLIDFDNPSILHQEEQYHAINTMPEMTAFTNMYDNVLVNANVSPME